MKQYNDIIEEKITGNFLTLTILWQNNLIIETELDWEKTPTRHSYSSTYSRHLKNLLLDYEQGKAVQWNHLPLDWARIPQNSFQKKVLFTLNTVSYGTIITYGKLSKLAGNPNGARAVGNIMSKNPWPLILPCHRVISTNKHLTGFKGCGGLTMKAWLLKQEGHILKDNKLLSIT